MLIKLYELRKTTYEIRPLGKRVLARSGERLRSSQAPKPTISILVQQMCDRPPAGAGMSCRSRIMDGGVDFCLGALIHMRITAPGRRPNAVKVDLIRSCQRGCRGMWANQCSNQNRYECGLRIHVAFLGSFGLGQAV